MIKSHSERDIYEACIALLWEMYEEMLAYMDICGVEYSKNPECEDYPGSIWYPAHIVRKLFLEHTSTSGGTSTRAKMQELGICSDTIAFVPNCQDEDL